MEIKYIVGDITLLEDDIIVNAANSSLRGGGGVDGAIHRRAGEQLYYECMMLNHCDTGDAKITKGYNLKAKNIIHTVGPIWNNGLSGEPQLLKDCYVNTLKLAEENGAKSIAFPCISTGTYEFPARLAAQIAIDVIKNYPYQSLERITFCCYQEKDYIIYDSLLNPTLEKKILTGFEKIKSLFRKND